MTKKTFFNNISFLSVPVILVLSTGGVQASLGNLGSTFGLTPVDIASTQSFSLFNSQSSAAYYNPAALSATDQGELYLGYLSATPSITAGDQKFDDVTQPILVGMNVNVTNLFNFSYPIYFGLIAGIENAGSEMMAFSSATSETGQLLNYGEKPLFVAASGSIQIIPGLTIGGGAQVSLHADAAMSLESELDGTSPANENVAVSAKPVMTPVGGVMLDFGRMACGSDKSCAGNGITLAAAYRGESYGQTNIKALATITQTVSELPINLLTYDAYQPDTISAGIRVKAGMVSVVLSGEQQKWSSLNDLMLGDAVKDQASVGFKNINIPRAGIELNFNDTFKLMAGASYEKSPLDADKATLDVNYLSADKKVFGAGFSYFHKGTGLTAYPWQIDLAYQYQKLKRTDHIIKHQDRENDKPVKLDGSVSTIALSFSTKF
ncbi:outer membrane protein transport protein [Moritella sp. 36]|uniref:OmpP1/FadL family transporter n=1 Tax=Moritella sp. 36 TaxID=2746233 RepID=UPI001BA92830|nr:outer membrane protein transport protein [Moritella sp. 36]QUM90654.1 outer membrane protein transport protein [Moritella sp. 36]